MVIWKTGNSHWSIGKEMDELIGQFKKKMTALIGQKEKKYENIAAFIGQLDKRWQLTLDIW